MRWVPATSRARGGVGSGDERADRSDDELGWCTFRNSESRSGCLLVTFGGIRSGFGMPTYEFMRLTSAMPATKLYLRDLHQAWYHAGFPHMAGGMVGLATFLSGQITAAGARRTVYVGNSMGGYAAILLGAHTRVDHVLAFSPQTFLGPAARLYHRDWRWRSQILAMYATAGPFRRDYDLRAWLSRRPLPDRCLIDVYYDRTHRLDALHAERLAGVRGVTLHPHGAGGHALVAILRDEGRLPEILADAIGG